MRVLITGASGFIGRALAERYRAAGQQVRGVDLVADPANDVVAGDVGVAGAWQDHAEGCDLVIHTAAVVSFRLEQPQLTWQGNVQGTLNALEAAERGGASRFVHFSSITVFGFDFPDVPGGVTERHPVRLTGVPYPDTKIAAEQVVLQAHAEGRIACTIIRPGDVYGPRSRPWAIMPVELIKSRQVMLPGGGKGIHAPVYVDNLVDGVALAAASQQGAGEVFTFVDPVGRMTIGEFFGRYGDALGMKVMSAPAAVARTGARAAHAIGRLRRDPDIQVHALAADYFLRRGTYSSQKARDVLGWEPQVDFEEGMRRTLDWLRSEGYLG
jgi:nucleoside-diphosphate-sugar epimerase